MEINMRVSNTKLLAIGAVILGFVVGVSLYLFYYVRMPEYSLKLIQEAIEKHDVVTFRQHVDLDSVVSKAYDDLAEVMMPETEMGDDLGAGLAKLAITMMKEPATKAISAEIIKNIEGNSTSSDKSSDAEYSDIGNKMGYKDLTFVGAEPSMKEGYTAIIPIKVHSATLNEDITLKLKMRELSDGKWQLYAVDNLKEFMAKLLKTPVKAQKQAAVASNVPAKSKVTADDKATKAQAELNRRGFGGVKISASTYGQSSDGFLAIDESSGGRILEVDYKNNRVADASVRGGLEGVESEANTELKSSMVVDFLIFSDKHDYDAESGLWEGDNHILPIHGEYTVQNGAIVPGMLKTGPGRNPATYSEYLNEPKNVDLMNMFMEQAMLLLREARKNNATF